MQRTKGAELKPGFQCDIPSALNNTSLNGDARFFIPVNFNFENCTFVAAPCLIKKTPANKPGFFDINWKVPKTILLLFPALRKL